MNPRERTLALVCGGIVALFAGRWLVMDVLLGPIRDREARLERLEEDLGRKQFQLTNQQAAAESLRKWKALSLPSDQNGGNSSVLYHNYLVSLLEKAGIKNPEVRVSPPRQVQNAYAALPFSIDAQCDLAQFSKLLFEFQRTNLLHSIKTVDLRPHVVNDKIQHLIAKLDVEVLAFPDAPARDKLVPGDKPDDRKLTDFKFFVEKNFFQPTNLVPIGQTRPAVARDDRSAVRFEAVARQNGVEWYYLYNSSTSKQLVHQTGETLDVAGFKGKIVGYDRETGELILKVGDKVGVVRQGQTLATWKESAKRAATLSLASQPTS